MGARVGRSGSGARGGGNPLQQRRRRPRAVCRGREITVAEMPQALWRMVLEINATGTFLGARAMVPRMLARGRWGHIVNTASTGGLMAPGGIAAYCASKYAVVGLSESLRAELAPAGIGVSVLCPGGVRSNLFASSVTVRAGVPGASEGMA